MERADALLQSDPALRTLVRLARERLCATEVWLFGSRARGEHRADSDYDIFLVLPDDAPADHLDACAAWQLGRDAGLVADVFAEREADVAAATGVANTLAFVLPHEGVRLG